MSVDKLAKRYANAVISIAEEAGELDRLIDDTQVVTALAASPDAMHLLTHPKISLTDKTTVISSIVDQCKCCASLKNTLLRMVNENHLAILGSFSRQLITVSDKKVGRVRIKLTVANKSDTKLSQKIKKLFESETSKEIVVETTVAPEIIGGLVIQNGSRVIDGSIRNKLDSLRKSFI